MAPLEAAPEIEARFSRHDLSEVAKMVHQDAEIRFNTLGMIPMSRDEYIAALEMILLSNSTIHSEIIRKIDLGNGWVASELVVSGTHDGPYFGIPASGKPTEVKAAKISRYDEDGLLTNLSLCFDNLTTLIQMGAVPAPAPEPEPSAVSPTSWGRLKAKFR